MYTYLWYGNYSIAEQILFEQLLFILKYYYRAMNLYIALRVASLQPIKVIMPLNLFL